MMLVTATEAEPKMSGDFSSFSSQKSGKKTQISDLFGIQNARGVHPFHKVRRNKCFNTKRRKFFLAGFIFTLGEHAPWGAFHLYLTYLSTNTVFV